MTSVPENDIGPLVWVKGEIDQSCKRAIEALNAYSAGRDTAQLKFAGTHIHQVQGALVIVGLDSAMHFVQTLGGLVADCEQGRLVASPERIQLARQSLEDLHQYLDDLANGYPDRPLRLLPRYLAIQQTRGIEGAGAGDLFFPDLSRRPPPRAPGFKLPPAELAPLIIRRERSRFQKGLLQFIRHGGTGVGDMRQAIVAVEACQDLPAVRTFWWVILGFFDILVSGDAAPDAAAKQLCSRIDGQLRRLVSEPPSAPERLLRDVLFYIASTQGGSAQADAVRTLFSLQEQVLSGSTEDGSRAPTAPAPREVREAVLIAKENWERFCAGANVGIAQLESDTRHLDEQIARLEPAVLRSLSSAVQETVLWLRTEPGKRNEAVGMEMATALLLIENAVADFEHLDPDIAAQVEALVSRLAALRQGQALPAPKLPLLDEIAHTAQERLLLRQVVREIQSNLTQIEQVLDAFFRDVGKRDGLRALTAPMKQVAGALTLLNQPRAITLLNQCSARITAFQEGEGEPAQFEEVADKLAALGFFVASLPYGVTDLDTLLKPEHRLPPPVEAVAEMPPEQVEPPPVAVAEEPVPTLQEPTTPAGEAETAPSEPDRSGRETIDPELLGIFLEEAKEVLNDIGQGIRQSVANNHDREALVVIRRGFHTLKGSGRMVNLKDLGEAAWSAEQVMNRWLQFEMDANSDLQRFLEEAHSLFSLWVKQLDEGGSIYRDAAKTVGLAEILLAGESLPGTAAPAVSTPADTTPPSVPSEPETGREEAAPQDGAPLPWADELPGPESLVAVAQMLYDITGRDENNLPALTGRLAPTDAVPANAAQPESPAVPEPVTVAPVAEVVAPPEAVTQPPAVRPDRVTIGSLTLSRVLYNSYVDEAVDLLTLLRAELDHLPHTPAQPPSEVAYRSAHTLSGISGTTGFVPVQRLAKAMELLMQELAEVGISGPDYAAVLSEGLGGLDVMLGNVIAQQMPEPLDALVTRIEAATIAVHAALVHHVDEPQPSNELLGASAVAEVEGNPQANSAVALRLGDDIDEQLLPIFLDESQDLMQEIETENRRWRQTPDNPAPADALARLLHTLKGSARMAGLMRLGEIVHSLESRVGKAIVNTAVTPEFFAAYDEDLDRISQMLDSLRVGKVSGGADIESATKAATSTAEAGELTATGAQASLRVRANLIDQLVNQAGEMSIARARIEGEMRTLHQSLLDLTENVIRLKKQVREIEIQADSQMQSRKAYADEARAEFDPLEFDRFTRFQELTRMMAESVNDVGTVQNNLLKSLDQADVALTSQARLNRELAQALMSVRMVPFNSLASRLYRLVRQISKELGKKANLEIRGGQAELDRSVLERIAAPLEHLLRNAITHGIEAPAQRQASGKPEIGEIILSVAHHGNEVTLELSDDGIGLDFERIRRRGEELGLLEPGVEVDQTALTSLIFRSGFSTAEKLSEVAGRGVGMDVVKNETTALGGRIDVSSVPGHGCQFHVYLPLTLAVTQAVLVRLGPRTYAIPSSMVAQAREIRPAQLQNIINEGSLEWMGARYPYHFLAQLFGDSQTQPALDLHHTWILLLRSGGQRIALHVDELRGNQEVVVKNIGPQLARAVGISGATVLGDGEVVLIINPVALAAREITPAQRRVAEMQLPLTRPVEKVASVPTIMVVDDSLTVRKITSRLLEREGYRVVTAKDGEDALEKLLDLVPEAMLVDIEMPRMDGFDLCRNIRADARLKHVPIIMITSRTAEKHRAYAREIGVNHYLGKPFQEDELLALLGNYTGQAAADKS